MSMNLEPMPPITDTSAERALLSIAISLKRIADRLNDGSLDNLGITIHNAICAGIWDARPKP